MEDFTKQAVALIQKRAFDAATNLLEESLRAMPAGWRPIQDFPDQQIVACWDTAEFLCYVGHVQGTASKKKVVWVPPSYSLGYYLLGSVRMDLGQVPEALRALDFGLQLEPEHPQLLNEKAYIFQKLKRPAEAFELFQRAMSARPNWTPNPVRARTLRGLGVTMVDFGKLDEAEAFLQQSLTVEPKNSLALSELDYIANLRKKRATF